MKAMKLYIGAGDVPLTQLYKEAGFRPVPISVVDILPGLQTGLIEAFNATPLAALAFQWFALAPHMADVIIENDGTVEEFQKKVLDEVASWL